MSNGSLTREHMKLLLQPARSHTRSLRRFDASISWAGILGAALIYASINIPAIMAVNKAGDQRLAPDPLTTAVDLAEAAPIEETPTEEVEVESVEATPAVANPTFTYGKVGIAAPLEWNIPYSAKNIKTALQNGLAHVKGSAQPGSNGTAIITGHSSNTAWAKGQYKTVFAPLLKGELGDRFSVKFNDTNYEYEVTAVYEVDPDKVALLKGTDGIHMRLITCTPLGTTKRRLIVDAVQITPEPTGTWQPNDINVEMIVDTR